MSSKVYDVEIIYVKSSFPKEKDIVSKVTQLLKEELKIAASKFKIGGGFQGVGTQLIFEIQVNSNQTIQQLLLSVEDVLSKNSILSTRGSKKKIEIQSQSQQQQQQQQFEEQKDDDSSSDDEGEEVEEEEQKIVENDKQKLDKKANKIPSKDTKEKVKVTQEKVKEIQENNKNMKPLDDNECQRNQSTKQADNRPQLSTQQIKNINDGFPDIKVRQNQQSLEQSSLLNSGEQEEVNDKQSKPERSQKEVKKESSEKIKKKQ